MNFFLQSTEYISTLRQKGFSDEGFYIEYDFICLELYKIRNPKALEEINNLQAKTLLQREKLR